MQNRGFELLLVLFILLSAGTAAAAGNNGGGSAADLTVAPATVSDEAGGDLNEEERKALEEVRKQFQEKLEALKEEQKKKGREGEPLVVNLYADEKPGIVQPQDAALVHFTASLAGGEVVATSRPDVEVATKAAASFWPAGVNFRGPVEVLAGSGGFFPGLGQEVMGLKPGDRKKYSLSPELAFGHPDPDRIKRYPLVQRMPKQVVIPPIEYARKAGKVAEVGDRVDLVPYFPSTVTGIDGDKVIVTNVAEENKEYTEPFGKVKVTTEGEYILFTMIPDLGAEFSEGDRQGVISELEGEEFLVDYNHPLAGMEVTVELEVLSLKKWSAMADLEPISWHATVEEGLTRAEQENKRVVLFLEGENCDDCTRMREEVFSQPALKSMGKDFVWLRVNKDTDDRYRERFRQFSAPTMLFLSSRGEASGKIEGLVDAAALHQSLFLELSRKKS
ncbi:MAG: thioredoxin family protein [Thermodesulfobacteriota bacterium]